MRSQGVAREKSRGFERDPHQAADLKIFCIGSAIEDLSAKKSSNTLL